MCLHDHLLAPMTACIMGPAGLMCTARYAPPSTLAVPFGGRRPDVAMSMFMLGHAPGPSQRMATWALRPHGYYGYEFSDPLALGVSDPIFSLCSTSRFCTPICTFSFMRRSHPLKSFYRTVFIWGLKFVQTFGILIIFFLTSQPADLGLRSWTILFSCNALFPTWYRFPTWYSFFHATQLPVVCVIVFAFIAQDSFLRLQLIKLAFPGFC